MSDLSYRLTELRSLLVPISQFIAWPVFFLLTTAISQQPVYFLALVLVVVADVFDSSPKNRRLYRDSIAGGTTAILALLLNDQNGLAIGSLVALVSAGLLIEKLGKRRVVLSVAG